jgi:hypothetical protein
MLSDCDIQPAGLDQIQVNPPSAVTPLAAVSASYWKGSAPCAMLRSPRW